MKPGATFLLSAGLVFGIGLPFQIWRDPEVSGPAPRQIADEGGGAQATTADVQAFDQLWRSLDTVHSRALELGASDYQRTVLDLTATYLELDLEARPKFVEASVQALKGIRDARTRMQAASRDGIDASRSAWKLWQGEQQAAISRIQRVLASTSRTALLIEKLPGWLLRLDYGMRR